MQISTIEEAAAIMKDPEFKGASVTMPFKKEIIPYLDHVHGVAKKLEVVNTVIKFCGKLHGFNTDWYGMYEPIKDQLNKKSSKTQSYCKKIFSYLKVRPNYRSRRNCRNSSLCRWTLRIETHCT
jgi:Shikimate 5-dehydrogenase